MHCEYCGSYLSRYPADGLCPNCGAVLPPQAPPAQTQQPKAAAVPLHPGITCCPRCYSADIHFRKRGFRWGLALLGLCFLPPFGLLFGLIGRNQLRYRCHTCSHRWKR